MMRKFIIRKEARYTMIDNRMIADPRLSFRAKGILLYLLSRPDGWVVHEAEIASRATDGTTSVRSGIQELIGAGYVVRNKVRNHDSGQFSGWEYEVYELSQADSVDSPQAHFTDVGQADVGQADVGQTATTNTDSSKTDDSNTDKEASDPPKPRFPFSLQTIMDAYNTAFGDLIARPRHLTSTLKDKLRTRLKSYRPEDLITVINKARRLPFYAGRNDRGWVATPEFLWRNDANVDRILAEKEVGSCPTINPKLEAALYRSPWESAPSAAGRSESSGG